MALTKITKSGLTDSAVERAKIQADAVDATKIADNAISEEHLDTTVITGNTELAEAAASNDILLVYDASAGVIKKILSSNIGAQPPTFSSVSPTNVNTGDGTGNATFTITGTNFDATATAKLKTTAGVEVNFDTVTRDSSTQITGVIAISSLSNANEPYDVVIINGNGLQVTAADQININAQPVYVTASGSLGEQLANTAGSFSVNATDPESAGNVTFELQSGSLPPGYSITNTAAEGGTAIISGTDSTTSSATTFNFTLRAVDAASNTTSRSFSITTTVPVTESFTSSGTFSVPSGITTADVLVVAAGGGGGGGGNGGYNGGGGGAGGLIYFPGYPVTPGGTVTITVGCGGSAGSTVDSTGSTSGGTGQDSAFGSPGDPGLSAAGVLTAKGGGSGGEGAATQNAPGGPGGSGGGAGSIIPGNNAPGGSATQPTQPGNSGSYGFGNAGGRTCSPSPGRGAGGGGAGGAGQDALNSNCGGNGGAGKAYTIADGTTPVTYASGGQGGSNIPSCAYPTFTPDAANKGHGGPGGRIPVGPGNAGGKGVVIVRY